MSRIQEANNINILSIPHFSRSQNQHNFLQQVQQILNDYDEEEIEEEDISSQQYNQQTQQINNSNYQQIQNQNKRTNLRLIIPKHRQIIFNGVIYINLGDKTDMQEFYEQFMTSENFQVRKIEKKNKQFSIDIIRGFYKDQVDTLQKLEYATYILDHSQQKHNHELALILNSLFNYCLQFQRHIDLVKTYYENNIQELYRIKQQRIEQMQKLSQVVRESLFEVKNKHRYSENLYNIINQHNLFNNQDQFSDILNQKGKNNPLNYLHENNLFTINTLEQNFILSIHFSPVFEQKIQSIVSYDVALPFVDLIGTTESEFISITMRSGFQCWLSDDACTLFNNQIAKCLITKEDITDVILPNQELITVDGIVLVCDMRFIFIQNMWNTTHPFLPVNLQPTLDYFIILKYEIQPKHLESLKKMRTKTDLSQAVTSLSSNIPYSIQSEIFFDKFYKDEYNNKLQQNDQSNSTIQKQNYCEDSNSSHKICGFADI